MERHSPWDAFGSAYNTPMPELSLMDLGLGNNIYGLSDLPEIDAIDRLQPPNIAAQHCNPQPTSLKLETELPLTDLAISPRLPTHSPSPKAVSPGLSPAEEMQDLRKEVSLSC